MEAKTVQFTCAEQLGQFLHRGRRVPLALYDMWLPHRCLPGHGALWMPPSGRPPGEDRCSRLGQAKTANRDCVGAQSIPPIFESIKSEVVDHREYCHIRSMIALQARPHLHPPHRVLLNSGLSPWRDASATSGMTKTRRRGSGNMTKHHIARAHGSRCGRCWGQADTGVASTCRTIFDVTAATADDQGRWSGDEKFRRRAPGFIPSPPDGFYPGAGALPRGGSVPWLGTPSGEPAKAQHIGQGQILEARPRTATYDLRVQQLCR